MKIWIKSEEEIIKKMILISNKCVAVIYIIYVNAPKFYYKTFTMIKDKISNYRYEHQNTNEYIKKY